MRALLLSLLLLASAGPGAAEPLGPAEQALLDDTRDRFIEAMVDGDFEYVVSVVPPRLLTHIAESAGVPVDDLVTALPGLMEAAMQGVSFSNFEMVTEDLDATMVVSEGEDYVWGFAPSSIDITVADQHFNSAGQTLVLLDGGTWYLVRTAETDKIEMLRGLYPFLSAVDFPEETLILVE